MLRSSTDQLILRRAPAAFKLVCFFPKRFDSPILSQHAVEWNTVLALLQGRDFDVQHMQRSLLLRLPQRPDDNWKSRM